jgi:hypothetical protein
VAAGSISYAAPSYITSGTNISPSRYGVKNGPAISVMVDKSFDTEQTNVRANVGSAGIAYGHKHNNWETMTTNSPYLEGEATGEETAQPFTVYTRDATVQYGKIPWSIPEPMNSIRGQSITTSTVVVSTIVTSTYVRSTSTGSINAFRITPTTLIRNNYTPVTTDIGAVGLVETV